MSNKKTNRISYSCQFLFGFLMTFLLISCTPSHKFTKKIVYKICDSLETYMAQQIMDRKNICIVVHSNCYTCRKLFPESKSPALFEIDIVPFNIDGKYNLDANHLKIVRRSNRFIRVKKRLYPIFISEVDEYLIAPPDKEASILYTKHGRLDLETHIPDERIFVNLDNCTFISQSNERELRGIKK